MCPKCVLAIGIGLLASVGLACCVKNAHLWALLGVVASVGLCMLLGEQIPPEEKGKESRS